MSRIGKDENGQMTVELAVALPVLIIVAVIAVNACTFFAECATFDRITRQAVRACAASPSYGQGADQSCAMIEEEVREALSDGPFDVAVSHDATGADLDEFTITLEYHPTLFGMGLRSQVFGVEMPSLVHVATYVIDVYKPGVIV